MSHRTHLKFVWNNQLLRSKRKIEILNLPQWSSSSRCSIRSSRRSVWDTFELSMWSFAFLLICSFFLLLRRVLEKQNKLKIRMSWTTRKEECVRDYSVIWRIRIQEFIWIEICTKRDRKYCLKSFTLLKCLVSVSVQPTWIYVAPKKDKKWLLWYNITLHTKNPVSCPKLHKSATSATRKYPP